MRKILLSLLTVGVVGATAFGLTTAFFSDTETSRNNTLVSGILDLLIDNTSYLNGVLHEDTTWTADDLPGHFFFNFTGLKPSDEGEDTISIKVNDNDAWACAEISLTSDDDNTCTEPELLDEPLCSEPDDDLFDGELGQNINFVFWVDDGDNVLETDEATESGILAQGPASDVLDGTKWTLADSLENNMGGSPGDPLIGGQTYYIGKAWCFGELTLDPVPADTGISPSLDPGVDCDGSLLDNSTQSDLLTADIGFLAVQHRNNPNFTCPTEEPCFEKADLMLVLDRSGSINASELATLKTAGKAFVDALTPSADGVHIGKVSFSTSATLNTHLTSDGAAVKAAIDALTSGGLTNLSDAIDDAAGELANPGDTHDRADGESPDFMVIITDGNPNRPGGEAAARAAAAAAADAARTAGIEIFVVGVGSDVDATYLTNEIANDAAHYYGVANFEDLSTVLEDIATCS